jgi:opacity protein-like surface antigen
MTGNSMRPTLAAQAREANIQTQREATSPLKLIAALAAVCYCNIAAAQDQSWYLSAKLGASEFDLENSFRNSIALDDARYEVDTRDTAFQLGLGYQLTPNYALEMHYGDLGESSLNASSALPALQINSEVQTRVLSLDFVASYPVAEQLEVFAKLGAARWDIEADTTVRDSATIGRRVQADEQDVSAKYGVGIRYAFAEQIALGLEFEQFKAGSDEITGEESLSTVNATMIYRF